MKTTRLNVLTIAILLLIPILNFAQAPALGTAANFVLFSSDGAVTNTGISQLTGNVGTNSGSSTGFGNVNGVMDNNNGASGQCASDLLSAYNTLNADIPAFFPSSLLGNGDTLIPGTYSISGAATLNLNLYLNAKGNANAVFIFQIQGPLSTNASSKIILINGALACNVFWKIEGLVSMAAGTTMRGTVIANNAAINMNTGDTLEGRALSTTGAVTVSGVLAYTPAGCGSPVLTGPSAPALASTACYAIFSGDGSVTNSGVTFVTGDVGTNVGLTTGFNALDVKGTIHPIPDGSTAACAADLGNVYTYLNTLPYDIELLYPAQFGNNLVLTPHTYIMKAATTFTDTLFLNAQGDANAVFVIQISGALSTSVYSKVVLINGTQAKNVYWVINGAVSINNFSVFNGTIICSNGAISLNKGVTINGRALTTTGALSTDSISITMPPGCPATVAANISVTTNVSCNGGTNGSVSSSPTGGTSPYTYSWQGGATGSTISNLAAGTYTMTVTDSNGSAATDSISITQPTALGISIASATALCNGSLGNATANAATGGTSPYTYSWTPVGGTNLTASSLGAGTYTISVIDSNGCNAKTSAAIRVLKDSVVGQTNILCNGGSTGAASIGVTYGDNPFTFLWAPTGKTNQIATGLSAGAYTVTVTNHNGCSSTTGVTITQPVAIRDSVASILLPCYLGTGNATIGVKEGVPPYTFTWMPNVSTTASATGLTVRSYTVSVNDKNGCSSAVIFSVTQPPFLRDSMVNASTVNVICKGGSTGSARVGVKNGTPPYTYLWNSGGQTNITATGLSEGSYTVTVSDNNGCNVTASVSITQPLYPLKDSVAGQTNILCNGSNTGAASIGVALGANPFTFLWAPTGKTNQIATGLSAGSYTVKVTNHNGCSNTTGVTITQSAAIKDSVASLTYLACYPRTGTVTIGVKGGVAPYTFTWTPGVSAAATAKGLTTGLYTVNVKDKNGCSSSVIFGVIQPSALRDSIVKASIINVLCYGANTGRATVGVQYGTAPYTYSWTPSGGNAATATGLSGGVYTVTVTDNKGCNATASVSITQPMRAMRDSVVSQTNELCNGASTASVGIGVSLGASPFTFLWTPTGKTNQIATGLSAGTYTVKVTNYNGCNNTTGVTITQPAAIRDSVASIHLPCYLGTGTAIIGVKGGVAPYTYTWTPGVSTTASATGLTVRNYTVNVKDKNGCSMAVIFSVTQPPLLRDSIVKKSTVNEICKWGSTGSATAGVKNGTPPYTYLWNSGGQTNVTATGLSAGGYTVTITDNNGCNVTASVSITQPNYELRDSVVAQTNVICNGSNTGAASIGVSLGANPFTFLWAPTGKTNQIAYGLSAGMYTVIVSNHNGCSNTVGVTITQSVAIIDSIVEASTLNVLCNGASTGSATVGVKNGIPPYTYMWNPGGQTNSTATGLSAGGYQVTVTDNNRCTVSAFISITQSRAMRDSVAGQTNILCNGASTGGVSIGVTVGANPFTFLWSPTGKTNQITSGLSAGAYTVTITNNNGCSNTLSVTITQPVAIMDSMVSFRCDSSFAGMVTIGVYGGTAPYTYLWSPGGGASATMSGLSNGTYTITVTDQNGCSGSALHQSVSCSTAPPRDGGTDGNNLGCCPMLNNVDIYPNPNTGQFTISGIEKGMMIDIYDYTGRRISTITASDETMQFNLSTQSNGMYLIRIISKDGNLVSQKKVAKTE